MRLKHWNLIVLYVPYICVMPSETEAHDLLLVARRNQSYIPLLDFRLNCWTVLLKQFKRTKLKTTNNINSMQGTTSITNSDMMYVLNITWIPLLKVYSKIRNQTTCFWVATWYSPKMLVPSTSICHGKKSGSKLPISSICKIDKHIRRPLCSIESTF